MLSLAGQLSSATSPVEGKSSQLLISNTISFSTAEGILGELLGIIYPENLSQKPLWQSCWYKGDFDVACGDEAYLQLEWWKECHRNEVTPLPSLVSTE